MLILRTRDGVPAVEALTDEAGRPVGGVTRITIDLAPGTARATIERQGEGGGVEVVEATVTRLAVWFLPDEGTAAKAPDGAPRGPAQRIAAVKAEIARLDRGDPAHYTDGGKPDTNVLSDRLGWRVTARERDEAWRQTQGESGAPGAAGNKGV